MRRVVMCAAMVLAVGASGCATKRYGRLTDVSGVEQTEMTCREVRLEKAKVEAFRLQVANGAKIDWRSVAGFLGDYGIGNAMEKTDAEKSATRRMMQLDTMYAQKRCDQEAPKVGILEWITEKLGFAD